MPLARTVLGDIEPEQLGVALAHEHLIIDSPRVEAEWPHIHLPSVSEAIAESLELAGAGVGTLVDAMPIGSGGDPARLSDVSLGTGINVIASTGMHTAKYYEQDDWHLTAAADELASEFVAVVNSPVSPAGLIKIATSGLAPTALEERLVEASVLTVEATGVPVLTHCEGGEGGLAQIELMAAFGMPLTRVAMSHTDKVDDPGYHRSLLETGVSLCFDQGLRQPERTARLLAGLSKDGFGAQLLIGTDGARRSLWATLGGSPGLAWINTGFRSLLIEHGLDEEALDLIYVHNPARWLSFAT